MLNFVQLLDINDGCGGLLPVVKLIRQGLFPIIQIGIPIILIVMGSIDLGKSVLSSDEKAIKASQSTLIKRCIAAVLVFFVTTIVTLLMDLLSTAGDTDMDNNSWSACWQAAAKAKSND